MQVAGVEQVLSLSSFAWLLGAPYTTLHFELMLEWSLKLEGMKVIIPDDTQAEQRKAAKTHHVDVECNKSGTFERMRV